MAAPLSSFEIAQQLEHHLQSWGLRRFEAEADYFRWQRSVLSAKDLSALNEYSQNRQRQVHPDIDVAFYDLSATPSVLPVLYSQRYDFFLAVGVAVATRLATAQRVLDFGCGIGVLTTFWATLFPHIEFVGIDRSSGSVAVASRETHQRELHNARFEHRQIPQDTLMDLYDCIVSTQALFQAEDDPGLPSQDWTTFTRSKEESLQTVAEARTGVGERLDSLCHALPSNGRMLLCEKTRHLGRRILLQRALWRRGLYSRCASLPLTYQSIGEHVDDGPLYEVTREGPMSACPWDEQPESPEGETLYSVRGEVAGRIFAALTQRQSGLAERAINGTCSGACEISSGKWGEALAYGYVRTSVFQGMLLCGVDEEPLIFRYLRPFETMAETQIAQAVERIWETSDPVGVDVQLPVYENHTPAAQKIWECLPERDVRAERTYREPGGRAMHIELGTAGGLKYVYWANTYDQRQLVMADQSESGWLNEYYHESLASAESFQVS